MNKTTCLFDSSINSRKAKPCSRTYFFCGKEGIKDAAHFRRLNPYSIISDFNANQWLTRLARIDRKKIDTVAGGIGCRQFVGHDFLEGVRAAVIVFCTRLVASMTAWSLLTASGTPSPIFLP